MLLYNDGAVKKKIAHIGQKNARLSLTFARFEYNILLEKLKTGIEEV